PRRLRAPAGYRESLELDDDQARTQLRREPGRLARHLQAPPVDLDEVLRRHGRHAERELKAPGLHLGGEEVAAVVAADVDDPVVRWVPAEDAADDPLLDELVREGLRHPAALDLRRETSAPIPPE